MDDSHVRLVSELKKLRSRDGMTWRKLGRQRTLLRILNRSTTGECYEMLVATLDALDDTLEARAVRNALGVDLDGSRRGLLGDRRYGLSAQPSWTAGKDMRTIEKYENDGFEELAHRLLRSGGRLVTSAHLGRIVTTELVVEQQERRHRFEDRQLVEMHEAVTVRAAQDGVRGYRVYYKTRAQPFVSTLSVQESNGLADASLFEDYGGWTFLGVAFGRELAQGERLDFDYRLAVISEVRGSPPVVRVYVDAPTEYLQCRVRFDPEAPRRAWGYRHSWDHDEDSRLPRLVQANEGLEMVSDFRDIRGRVDCGITWEW